MDPKMESKLRMYLAVEKYGDENPITVELAPAFHSAFITFKAKVAEISDTAQQLAELTKGITHDKSEAKKTLCKVAADLAAPILAYAAKTENHTLKEQVNFSYTDLYKAKDDELPKFVKNIHKAGSEHLPKLAKYGITPPVLVLFETAMSTYENIIPDPGNAAVNRKTLRLNLKELFAETDLILKEQMDKFITVLKSSSPGFVSNYKNNRVFLDPAKTDATLKGQIMQKDSGEPIWGATIQLHDTEFKTTTNKSGMFKLKKVPFGNYIGVIAAEDFDPIFNVIVTVKPGEINHLKIELHQKK